MFNLVTVVHENNTLNFLFPSLFSNKAIVDAVKYLRRGDGRNWKREFLNLDISVAEVFTSDIPDECKYIVVYDKDQPLDSKYMIIFPKVINHDYMFEMVQHAAYDSDLPNKQMPISIFSAGFVLNGNCYGRSETLSVQSHKDDNELCRKTFGQ
jgi:hypothetical protein